MNEAVVHIVYDRCHIDMNMPVALQTMPKINLKKIWMLQLKQPWNNEKSIVEMERWIHTVIRIASDDWRAASQDYSNGYKTTQFDYLLPKQKRKIEADNRKLALAVKHKKTLYDRSLKLLTQFTEIKQKLM